MEGSYTDPAVSKFFGQPDLVVNVAPSPPLIEDAGGRTWEEQATNYVKTLIEMTAPRGRIYTAIDSTTLARYQRPLENAFRALGNVGPVYHAGGSLAASNYFDFSNTDSTWINDQWNGTWVEYLIRRR